jgi:SPP1 family predicted phage head-tail adaptor
MAINVNAGDFKKKVVFKQPTVTKNSEGGIEKGYTVQITTWAAERKIDQRRVLEAGAQSLVDTRLLYIRYAASRSVIAKDWLIEIDGADYVITAKPVVIDEAIKLFEIQAKAKQ